MPRFAPDNYAANRMLMPAYRALAQELGCTSAQLAIAWLLHRGEDIVPLVGIRRRKNLTDSLGALAVRLSADDIAAIETAMPKDSAAGTRYAAMQMAHLDSEHG